MENTLSEPNKDVRALRAIIAAQALTIEENARELEKRDTVIDILKGQLALLRHARHGRSSEKINRQIEQLELMLEELQVSRVQADVEAMDDGGGDCILPTLDKASHKPARKPLPDNVPREDRIYAAPCTCPQCGGTSFLKSADRIVQVMDYVPASIKVVRHIEQRMTCKGCDTRVSGHMPSLPIKRGKPGPGLLAHIMIAKFDDHCPLYRQSEIFARDGIDISREVAADWVGRVSALVSPIVRGIKDHVSGADRIHTDDTPVDVLNPGSGKTKTGRMWVYVLDGSGYQDKTPKAVAYYYSPDRKGEHPAQHLKDFSGVLHADGYAGYQKLYGNSIVEAACMAHVRRKFHDVIKLKASPLAEEALNQISALYDIEARIRGTTADERRAFRQQYAKPKIEALRIWIEDNIKRIPQKQRLAGAMRYALSRWKALCVYLDDGRVEIDNNIAERAVRPIGIGRKNWLFAGSDKGG